MPRWMRRNSYFTLHRKETRGDTRVRWSRSDQASPQRSSATTRLPAPTPQWPHWAICRPPCPAGHTSGARPAVEPEGPETRAEGHLPAPSGCLEPPVVLAAKTRREHRPEGTGAEDSPVGPRSPTWSAGSPAQGGRTAGWPSTRSCSGPGWGWRRGGWPPGTSAL